PRRPTPDRLRLGTRDQARRFRLMVRRDAVGVRLLTRNGIDWSGRFPLIAEAAGWLQQAARLALPLGPLTPLAQVQEPGSAGGEAGGGGGLAVIIGKSNV